VDRANASGPGAWNYFKFKTCIFGYKIMESNLDNRGSYCTKCGMGYCPNPGCSCKRTRLL
jgi:hypothetical protein